MRPSALTDPNGPRWPDRIGLIAPPGKENPPSPEWMAWVRECDEKRGYVVCGRSNRFDEPCEEKAPQNPRVEGKPVWGRPPCKSHGGGSNIGIAHHNYKDGRTKSRYNMRGRLAKYDERLEDMEYLSLQSEMAVVEELLEQSLAVLDDETPCPEPWHEPPLDPEVDGKKEAKARALQIHNREVEIRQWHQARAAATERVDALMEQKGKLTRTEIMRVKAAQDTLAGAAVRMFSDKLLQVNRRHWLAFGKKHDIPTEYVLAAMAEMQEDFVNVVQDARGYAGGRPPREGDVD